MSSRGVSTIVIRALVAVAPVPLLRHFQHAFLFTLRYSSILDMHCNLFFQYILYCQVAKACSSNITHSKLKKYVASETSAVGALDEVRCP